MSDEKERLEQSIKRGRLAESVLENPIYKEAMIAIRGELLAQFERTRYRDSDDRDEIWRKYQTVDWVEARLSRVMKHGVVAEKTLLQMAKEKVHRLFKNK